MKANVSGTTGSQPEDYIRDFSPDGPAELIIHIRDERPSPGLRSIARRIRNIVREYTVVPPDANDVQAEIAWKTIQETRGQVTAEEIERFLQVRFSYDHLRKFEYAFFAHCLSRPDVSKSVIVDVGGGNSYSTVVPILLRLPESRILSLDPVNHPRRSKYGVEYVQGDAMCTNLPAQSADVVALISTLEHIGLGRWGDPLAVDGDIKAMREALRVLRTGGHVVLTIPYGYPTVVFNLHRIYDAGRLNLLTQGFEIVLQEYSLHGQPATRDAVEGRKATKHIPGYYEDTPDQQRHPDTPAGTLLLLRKI